MPANDNWWIRQLFENMMEASIWFKIFYQATEPNIDDYDRATTIYEECCNAYEEIKNFDFKDFIEIGESLRTRQVSLKKANKL